MLLKIFAHVWFVLFFVLFFILLSHSMCPTQREKHEHQKSEAHIGLSDQHNAKYELILSDSHKVTEDREENGQEDGEEDGERRREEDEKEDCRWIR